MDRSAILEVIENEISRLQQVRTLLTTVNGNGLTNGNGHAHPRKRVLSEDARNRIAQAQKRRWAKQRKEMASAKNG